MMLLDAFHNRVTDLIAGGLTDAEAIRQAAWEQDHGRTEIRPFAEDRKG